ncbi:MAG TPA: DNA alkylation repair protein [Chryseosolibacter sp.]|nr:DNA alkylation repair protein [Chryseosolibacter sp.]
MANAFHASILSQIEMRSGQGTKHTISDTYLGTSHPRYEIAAPSLREIAKSWAVSHKHLSASQIADVITSLIKGKSATEKIVGGMLLDYITKAQRDFEPELFTDWLDHLEGWAEVDAVCTNKHSILHIVPNFSAWKRLLKQFSKSDNIHKRRASLVFLCSPVRHHQDERLIKLAFENIERLKGENEILITKAISWLLRSLIKHYKEEVADYVKKNADSLPKIAVRETLTKLKTGKKTKSKQ